MPTVGISNMETAKILRHAFEIGFDTITIIAEKENFSIIGLDESSSIAAQVTFELSEFDYSFDHPAIFPVNSRDFGTYLGYSTSKHLPAPSPITLTIGNTMNLSIMSPLCRLQRVFTPESKGIESLPQLPSFEDMPCCDISEIGPLNLSKSIFGKSESVIVLKMNPEKISFSSPDENQFFELNGRGHGTASTVLRPYTLAVVSQVWELTSINNLTISISDDGMTKFFYTFNGGTLWYVAASSVEE